MRLISSGFDVYNLPPDDKCLRTGFPADWLNIDIQL